MTTPTAAQVIFITNNSLRFHFFELILYVHIKPKTFNETAPPTPPVTGPGAIMDQFAASVLAANDGDVRP